MRKGEKRCKQKNWSCKVWLQKFSIAVESTIVLIDCLVCWVCCDVQIRIPSIHNLFIRHTKIELSWSTSWILNNWTAEWCWAWIIIVSAVISQSTSSWRIACGALSCTCAYCAITYSRNRLNWNSFFLKKL